MTEIEPVAPGPQGAASVVMYRVGGRQYPLKSVGQCKVCSSEHRLTVEQEIANARTYAAIVKSLPEDHGLTPRNLRDHYINGHMPLEIEAMRSIIDERARIRGVSIEHGSRALVDHVSLAETVVQKAYEQIASGELRPTIRDGIRAATLLHQVGLAGSEDSQADVVQAFVAYMETSQKMMTPTQWAEFGKALAEHPILRALKAKSEAAQRGLIEGNPDDVEG